MFVYLSSQQHGIFLNVFPTFFSHHNKDTYYLRLNTVDKRTKHQKVITSHSTNLPLILNSILTFYFACRRQCRRRCFFGGHWTCFSFLFFLLFPQLNFTFPLWILISIAFSASIPLVESNVGVFISSEAIELAFLFSSSCCFLTKTLLSLCKLIKASMFTRRPFSTIFSNTSCHKGINIIQVFG